VRDLLVAGFVILSLPACFRRPFIGLLLFTLLAYMRVQDLTWGWARYERWSFYVAIVTLAGFVFAKQEDKRLFLPDMRSWIMVGLMAVVGVSLLASDNLRAGDFENYTEYCKIIGVALFTTAVVRTRDHLRLLIWVIALSFGFFGAKNGANFIAHAGNMFINQGPGGMMADNNDFALALVMGIPLVLHLGLADGRAWVKRATQAAVFFSLVSIVLTHSRGAFLAMTMTALWMAWRSGRLVRAGFGLAAAAGVFLLLAPESVLERLSSIGDTKESSANARLTAWATAFRMIGDNPLLGVGLRNFQPRYAEYSVVPLPPGGTTYVAHNSYLQIWAESGSLAFVVYLLLLASVFATCRRIATMGRLRPDLAWAANYARMMEATTIGFMVGAVFLNRGHFDLVYHWIGLVTSLTAIAAYHWVRAPRRDASGQRAQGVTVRAAPAFGVAAAVSGTSPRWGR